MNVSIFGLGYVGAVSLACLARDGHHVTGVDVEPAKLDLIRDGRTPVVEEGMVELMRSAVASGRVHVTDDARAAILNTDVSLVCVGTPSAANGSQDQTAVLRLAEDIGAALAAKNDGHVIVFRSTLVPGTVEDTLIPVLERASGKRAGRGFDVCFQPEFLREGSSIRDYDHPPFTIVGAATTRPVETLRQLFGHLPCEFNHTSIRAAEVVKYCCNNFHALKITFANETARLCEALGVDPFQVMDLVCRDRHLNISPAYLTPGFAFGGSCLPKDLRATMHFARQRDVELPMHGSILASNRHHAEHAIAKVMALGRRRIGMIGLSFKSGTDDLRESPLVMLAEHFLGKGMSLLIYDSEVHLSNLLGANRRFIEQHLPHVGSLIRSEIDAVIDESDVLVVGQSEPRAIARLIERARVDQTVIDLVRLPGRERLRARYQGLCWQ
jgi:GDP-mannose 6-dehydrogenase